MPDNSPPLSPEIVDHLMRDALPLGYIIWDPDGNGLDCSPGVVQFFGLQTPQEVFENWDRLSPSVQPIGHASEFCFNKIFALVGAGEKIISDWWHQTIDGQPIPVEITCQRHCANGRDLLVAYLRDKRGWKQPQHDPVAGHPRFASILRSCPICFAALSEDRFTFVTPFMSNFLGVQIGDTFSSIIADPKIAEKLCGEADEDEITPWIHVPIRTQYGEIKEMLLHSIDFEDTEYSERIIWLLDITQSRRLESELKAPRNLPKPTQKRKANFSPI